ncbi:hypothetical protein B6U82_00230 [Candidatus Pacearchaeota archaeon ex4484_31]|nr:MAG: hypothetical protein B6U82_00230 [Candidatus Pacearchaeota archaeon ex4484_31]
MRKKSKSAILGFVLSMLSFLILTASFYIPRDSVLLGKVMFVTWVLGFFVCFVSLIFCSIGIKETIRRKLAGKSLAIAGLIIDIAALIHALWYVFKPRSF